MAIDVPDWLQLTQLASPGLLGICAALPGQAVSGGSFNLSPFATGLVVIPIGTAGPLNVTIIGGVSANTYAQVVFGTTFPPVLASVLGATDNPVSVSVPIAVANPGPGNLTTAFVYQLFGTGIDNVLNTPQQPLYIADQPPTFQQGSAAATKTLQIIQTLAVSTSATLLAGIAGKTVTIWGYEVNVQPSVI